MALFDNSNPEEFLLFIRYFNMTIEASETIETAANIHYLRALVRRKTLHQLGMLSAEVGSTTQKT